MPHIPMFDYETASPEARAEHDREIALRGRMTNMKRTLLHSPVAHRIYAEWFTLRDLLSPVLNDREIWLLSLAIAETLAAPIPIGFFRRALDQQGLAPETLERTGDEQLLEAFGRAFATDSRTIPELVWNRLKRRYDAATLVNLVAFAGIMLATAAFTNAVNVEIDPEIRRYLPDGLEPQPSPLLSPR